MQPPLSPAAAEQRKQQAAELRQHIDQILPDTLGELLLLALADTRWAEQQPNFVIDMELWYEESLVGEKPCYCCMAGAMLRHQSERLGLPMPCEIYAPDITNKLKAVDYLRIGHVTTAAYALYGSTKGSQLVAELGDRFPRDRDDVIPEYCDDAEGFHKHLTQLANELCAVSI